ncbi:PepSY-associated TM helix domain-containing protein [Hydrogenophaga luteola]|uniref:PepSY-associated TM helix domain-containing protein n=1 Tax=Hydrogenophaga luteola TaxID=1591122 RepID=A0ABV7VXY5_9BURK
MTPRTLRIWTWLHTWSSLICTVFMLLLCLTGLPLIFHHEIGHLLGTEVEAPEMPPGTPMASMDKVLASAQARAPDLVPTFAFQEPDEPDTWLVGFAPEPLAQEGTRMVVVDARTGEALGEPPAEEGFIYVMFKLHVDLFAGLPGKLFLGLMGLLMVIAIVSGVVLYAPFMRKLPFGTVRRDRSARLKWLDLHNLLGVVTLSWALVVGFTGVINTWADLVIKLWQFDQLGSVLAPYKSAPPPTRHGSLQAATAVAQAAEPDMKLAFVAFPGTQLSSPHHFAVFMRGTEPLTARLFKPVLVDVQSLEVTARLDLPWYVTGLLVSQPLHFGDYGGRPMQILWAVLDVITIFVLGSGLYLWLQRRRTSSRQRLSEAPDLPEPAQGQPLGEGRAS